LTEEKALLVLDIYTWTDLVSEGASEYPEPVRRCVDFPGSHETHPEWCSHGEFLRHHVLWSNVVPVTSYIYLYKHMLSTTQVHTWDHTEPDGLEFWWYNTRSTSLGRLGDAHNAGR
jgi:hypothetical protein